MAAGIFSGLPEKAQAAWLSRQAGPRSPFDGRCGASPQPGPGAQSDFRRHTPDAAPIT